MSDFAEDEAEESGSDVGSSEHEEELEETEADRAFVVEGPVVDDVSESSGASEDEDDDVMASGPVKKRRRVENLDEEDLELLEENLGVKLKRVCMTVATFLLLPIVVRKCNVSHPNHKAKMMLKHGERLLH
jgi:hypothetical protein